MIHHWGTDYNAAQFAEQPAVQLSGTGLVVLDDTNAPVDLPIRVAPRPEAGAVLQVRDASTLAGLTAFAVDGSGYWLYTHDDPAPVFGIQVSGDGGVTWSAGVLWSAETLNAAMQAGPAMAAALARFDALSATVSDLQRQVGAGTGVGGGLTGGNQVFRTDAEANAAPDNTLLLRFVPAGS